MKGIDYKDANQT